MSETHLERARRLLESQSGTPLTPTGDILAAILSHLEEQPSNVDLAKLIQEQAKQITLLFNTVEKQAAQITAIEREIKELRHPWTPAVIQAIGDATQERVGPPGVTITYEDIAKARDSMEQAAAPRETLPRSSALTPGPVEKPSWLPDVSLPLTHEQIQVILSACSKSTSPVTLPVSGMFVIDYSNQLLTLRWPMPSISTQEDGGHGLADPTEEGGPDYDYGREVAKVIGSADSAPRSISLSEARQQAIDSMLKMEKERLAAAQLDTTASASSEPLSGAEEHLLDWAHTMLGPRYYDVKALIEKYAPTHVGYDSTPWLSNTSNRRDWEDG